MRHMAVLTAVLLSSSMLAATAATAAQSQLPQCKSLERLVNDCQSGARSKSDTGESCDRIEAGFVALCGPLGTIGISASAAGGALSLLGQDYQVVPIAQTTASVFPSHLVIGPAELNNSQVVSLLKRSYGAGKTVAIVGATQDQADRFHSLLRPGEKANCRPAKGQATIPLYGLQTSRNRTPPQNSSYCLVNLSQKDPQADRQWLRERFGLIPPQPAAGNVGATEDPNDLTSLATATHCSSKTSNSSGSIGADAYVYTMRDFTDTGCSSCKNPGADYYLVQDNLTYEAATANANFFLFAPGLADLGNGVGFTSGSYSLEFADPVTTTTYEDSYTNGSSETADGSVGFGADGPNVTVGGSTTTDHSTSYSVPPTTILNQSNVATALPQWTFTPQSFPAYADFTINPTWTWFVPRDAYPSGGMGNGQVQFQNVPRVYLGNNDAVEIDQFCNVLYPFEAWTVNPPALSSLSSTPETPTPINGGQFTITGQYLYPSSIIAVQIGGNPVPANNISPQNDTTIVVTVPSGYAAGTYQVQVTTEYNGENRFSNTLPLYLTN